MIFWYRVEFYRYGNLYDDLGGYDNYSVRMLLLQYPVIKSTPKGVWLRVGFGNRSKRFVRYLARRQWASPSIKEAKEKFANRKRAQIRILKREIYDIQRALTQLDDIKEDHGPTS